jgi:hypothetical protein
MPRGNEVRPGKWSSVIDLFDDGNYSAIWGRYDGVPTRRLGVRWNGKGDDVGYPSQGGNSLWYAEPNFLVLPVLFKLLEHTLSSDFAKKTEYISNINIPDSVT